MSRSVCVDSWPHSQILCVGARILITNGTSYTFLQIVYQHNCAKYPISCRKDDQHYYILRLVQSLKVETIGSQNYLFSVKPSSLVGTYKLMPCGGGTFKSIWTYTFIQIVYQHNYAQYPISCRKDEQH